jgi:hypothetical protein
VFPITPLSMTILILRERRPNKKHNSAVAWIAHVGLSVEMAATKNISFFVGAPPSMIFAASAPNAGTTKSTFPWTDANYSLIFKTLECRHESRLTIERITPPQNDSNTPRHISWVLVVTLHWQDWLLAVEPTSWPAERNYRSRATSNMIK